jgi:hypothetical protein
MSKANTASYLLASPYKPKKMPAVPQLQTNARSAKSNPYDAGGQSKSLVGLRPGLKKR